MPTKAFKTVGKSFPVKDSDFVTSSYTHPGGKITRCVQVARKRRGVAIRDSKDPTKTTMFFNRGEWNAFLRGAKEGQFDLSSTA